MQMVGAGRIDDDPVRRRRGRDGRIAQRPCRQSLDRFPVVVRPDADPGRPRCRVDGHHHAPVAFVTATAHAPKMNIAGPLRTQRTI